jgi:hypothetical protein
MQSIHDTSEYLKIYSKRYVSLRLVCFSTLFIYGLLNLLEKSINNVMSASEYIIVFELIKTLIGFKKHIYAMHRQLELARLVVRFFDFPANVSNFFKFFEDTSSSETNKTQNNKIKVSEAFTIGFKVIEHFYLCPFYVKYAQASWLIYATCAY